MPWTEFRVGEQREEESIKGVERSKAEKERLSMHHIPLRTLGLRIIEICAFIQTYRMYRCIPASAQPHSWHSLLRPIAMGILTKLLTNFKETTDNQVKYTCLLLATGYNRLPVGSNAAQLGCSRVAEAGWTRGVSRLQIYDSNSVWL